MHIRHVPSPTDRRRPSPNAIFVKLGSWFEASASGWGVLVVPVILAIALLASLLAAG